ncbi:BglG family transcription antiterminator [Ornithinibacillus sp. 179-J 7C1 HS]|uniref:BglG family transcription antiterminator n=1 Tax=Ornithinibacillus sp. 179-J 7C1 HS TaxID=3142384 RepID=UPI0039A2CD8D
MYISSRERKIIEILFQSEEDVTVKVIAEMLDVSERTIHRDLKNITGILSDYDLELVKRSGIGLRIIGTNQNKQEFLKALNNQTFSEFTSEERRAIILSSLLEAKEPTKLFTLANELNVTIATISHDLDQLEGELESFNLQLIRKRGYGVEINGEEIKKRAALSQIITTYIEPFKIVSLNQDISSKWESPSEVISSRLLGSVDPKKLFIIQNVVEKVRRELPHELADNSYIGLVVHLALAMERLQKGEHITFDTEYMDQIKETIEYSIARKIIQDLGKALSLDIPTDEIGYITMHLMGAKLQLSKNYFIEDSTMDIAVKANELIQFVSSNLSVDLTDNISLLNDLVAHLKPTVYRIKQGMPIKNPMLKVIKEDYLELFDLIRQGVSEIFNEMKIPDAEIGYLVLHFAATLLNKNDIRIHALVICSSGIGTAKILASKLLQKIPEIEQVENKSIFDLDELNLDDYEVIISTIPLSGIDREYIVTSPMLTDVEVQRIQKMIRKRKLQSKPKLYETPFTSGGNELRQDFIYNLKATQQYSEIILSLLEVFQVNAILEPTSMEVLNTICTELEALEIIRNKRVIHDKLIKREQISGLGIPNTSMSLYHARSDEVVKPCFRVYTLPNPILVRGMDEADMEINTILLMLAPENTSKEVLEILSYISNLLIQREENIRLFELGDEIKIKEFLTKQFQRFLKEKNLF